MNTLPQALDEYLALRQAMGFQVRDARSLLGRFILETAVRSCIT